MQRDNYARLLTTLSQALRSATSSQAGFFQLQGKQLLLTDLQVTRWLTYQHVLNIHAATEATQG